MPRFTIRLFKYGINKCFPPILLAGLVDSLCFLRLSKFTKLGVTWISISEMNSRLTHHEFAERSQSVDERSKLCGNINFQYLRCPNAPRIFNSLNSLGLCVFRPCTSCWLSNKDFFDQSEEQSAFGINLPVVPLQGDINRIYLLIAIHRDLLPWNSIRAERIILFAYKSI